MHKQGAEPIVCSQLIVEGQRKFVKRVSVQYIMAQAPPAAIGPPGPPAAVLAPRTYAEWYAQARIDPFHGAYAHTCGAFVPALDANRLPVDDAQQLLDQVVSTERDPHAFLMLVPGPQAPSSCLLHRLLRIRPRFGYAASPLQGRTFALLGDIREVDLTTVEWPLEALQTTPEVIVPNIRELENELTTHPGQDVLGPYVEGANYEAIRTRNVMYVPPKYVSLVLQGGLKARALWERVGRAIIADGNEAPCASLLNWLRVALVRAAPAPAVPVVVRPAPPPILGDVLLSHHRAVAIKMDLPHRFPPPPVDPIDPAGTLVQALGAMRRDFQAER
ncbi:MAG: hypothetical protein ACREBR_01815, partial [bacterium]